MATMTMRFKKLVVVPSAQITVQSTFDGTCGTVVSLSIDPEGQTRYVELVESGDYISITPGEGVINSTTSFTLTLGGFKSLHDSFNTGLSTATVNLRESIGGTILDTYSIDRFHIEDTCGDIITDDPDDDPDPGDDEIINPDDFGGGGFDGEPGDSFPDPGPSGPDFDDNGGFGFDWPGRE